MINQIDFKNTQTKEKMDKKKREDKKTNKKQTKNKQKTNKKSNINQLNIDFSTCCNVIPKVMNKSIIKFIQNSGP